jgi:hypothetical protein
MRYSTISVSMLVVLALCGSVRAEDDTPAAPAAQQRQQQPPAAEPPPKQPPPPLFPRHRRGIYRDIEGREAVDATPQSPPLETDDPGVPDEGEFEINFTTHADLSHEDRRFDVLFVDANYGTLPKIAGHELPTQIKFEFPIAAIGAEGEPYRFGIGAAKFGLKFNFYEHEHAGLWLSVYPQIEFEAPGSGGVEKGLAEPGQTLILPLLLGKEFHYFTFVANVGIEHPLNNPDRGNELAFGFGFGRALTRKVAAMFEVRTETELGVEEGERLTFLNVGVMRSVRNAVLYAKVGHTLSTSDDVSHTYLGVGLKVLIRTKPEPPKK